MTGADAVRRVGLALPRTYEAEVRGRWKLRVGQIVYVAFSRDELSMGFGFPMAERDGLIGSDPETFFLPSATDLRFQWVCAHLPRLDEQEMRELVTDAWRMCTPRMLHDLPDLPAPAMAAYGFLDAGEYGELRQLLHPYVHFIAPGRCRSAAAARCWRGCGSTGPSRRRRSRSGTGRSTAGCGDDARQATGAGCPPVHATSHESLPAPLVTSIRKLCAP